MTPRQRVEDRHRHAAGNVEQHLVRHEARLAGRRRIEAGTLRDLLLRLLLFLLVLLCLFGLAAARRRIVVVIDHDHCARPSRTRSVSAGRKHDDAAGTDRSHSAAAGINAGRSPPGIRPPPMFPGELIPRPPKPPPPPKPRWAALSATSESERRRPRQARARRQRFWWIAAFSCRTWLASNRRVRRAANSLKVCRGTARNVHRARAAPETICRPFRPANA